MRAEAEPPLFSDPPSAHIGEFSQALLTSHNRVTTQNQPTETETGKPEGDTFIVLSWRISLQSASPAGLRFLFVFLSWALAFSFLLLLFVAKSSSRGRCALALHNGDFLLITASVFCRPAMAAYRALTGFAASAPPHFSTKPILGTKATAMQGS